MNISDWFDFVQLLARKNQTGSITPKEFNSTANSAQRWYFDTLLGRITPIPHVALGQNERIAEKLRPFKVQDSTITISAQIASYPTGFQAITSMTDGSGKGIQYIDDAKLAGRLNSVIDPIADADPAVFTVTPTGWKIYPSSVTSVKVSYYKTPTDVKYVFTLDGNGRSVYDSGNSVQPLWDNHSIEEIIKQQCLLLGISFQSPNLVQYAKT